MTIQEHIEYLTKRGYYVSADKDEINVYRYGSEDVTPERIIKNHIDALRSENPIDVKNYIILVSYPLNFMTRQ